MWLEVYAHKGFKKNSALAAAQRNGLMPPSAILFSLTLGVVLKTVLGCISFQSDWIPDLADHVSKRSETHWTQGKVSKQVASGLSFT